MSRFKQQIAIHQPRVPLVFLMIRSKCENYSKSRFTYAANANKLTHVCHSSIATIRYGTTHDTTCHHNAIDNSFSPTQPRKCTWCELFQWSTTDVVTTLKFHQSIYLSSCQLRHPYSETEMRLFLRIDDVVSVHFEEFVVVGDFILIRKAWKYSFLPVLTNNFITFLKITVWNRCFYNKLFVVFNRLLQIKKELDQF